MLLKGRYPEPERAERDGSGKEWGEGEVDGAF